MKTSIDKDNDTADQCCLVLGAYLADCRIQQPADKALDLNMSARLWDRAEEEIRTALQKEGLNT